MKRRIAMTALLAAMWVGATGCPPEGAGGARSGGGGWNPFETKPKGEPWQIVCCELEGATRYRDADELAAALKRVPNVQADRVSVVHEAKESVVTYGPYYLAYDQGTVRFSEEITRDKRFLMRLAVGQSYPFMTAHYRRVPSENVGPSEYDLRNCGGVYTLQIGVFFNTPAFHERKEAAVAWVNDLRGRGHEAWYYHDDSAGKSTVTVGTFDSSAFIGSSTIKVAGQTVIEPKDISVRDYSREVIELQQNEEFRYNLINAGKETVNGVPQSSFLVRVPKGQT
jgi:hypothetical protein